MAKPEWFEESHRINLNAMYRINPEGMEQIRFYALALAGEAGELANRVKKEWRDASPIFDYTSWKSKLREELADVRIYKQHLAEVLQMDLDEECIKKLAIVAKRPYAQAATDKPEGS